MPENNIKHLVISSGGPAGIMMYNILRTLNLKGVWDIKNIQTIYGSSVGSFIAVLIALNYDWATMDDFILKRPWDKIFRQYSSSGTSNACAGANPGSAGSGTVHTAANSGSGGSNNTTCSDNGHHPVNDSHGSIVSATIAEATSKATSYAIDAKNKLDIVFKLYNQHGIYGLKEFTETLRPALQGKDMTVSITLQEFYQKTGIELHFIVTEMNKFITVDFSHKTHPTQSLVEACYMSCCYPFVFSPIYRDGCCYTDGGIINDYPVNECLQDQKCDVSEILGIKMLWERKPANLTEKSSVLQFVSTFFNQIKGNLFENRPTRCLLNEVVCVSKIFASQDWMNCIKDENYRRELMLRGETFANVFLSYRRNFRETNVEIASPVQSRQTSHVVVETLSSPASPIPIVHDDDDDDDDAPDSPDASHTTEDANPIL
jgi:predicted acylesterase/phospholipase RssA